MTDKRYDTAPLDQLQHLSDGQLDLIENVHEIFRNSFRQSLATLVGSLAQKDLITIRKQSHTLKSNCGAVGLMKMARQFQALERKSETEWSEIQELIEAIEAEHPLSMQALDEDIQRRRQNLADSVG